MRSSGCGRCGDGLPAQWLNSLLKQLGRLDIRDDYGELDVVSYPRRTRSFTRNCLRRTNLLTNATADSVLQYPAMKGPLRVLFVEQNEDGTVGGSHRVLVDLVTRLDRRHYEPVVLFYEDNRHVAALRGRNVQVLLYDAVRARELEIRRHGSRIRKWVDFVGAVVRRVRLLKAQRIDLVHLNNHPAIGIDDWLPAARLARVPCISWVAGTGGPLGWLGRFSVRRFDSCIAVSDYTRQYLRQAGMPERRIALVYPGVDSEQLRGEVRQSRSATRTQHGVPPGAILVLMVGNIRHWKGQHVLIEAFAGLEPAVRSQLQLRFVGAASDQDAEYLNALKRRIRAIGAESQVQFLGTRDDVPTLLAAADVAVHASVEPEPFGLVVPEAMVHGVPVIASKFGGPGEIITPESGRTFDPSDPTQLSRVLAELAVDPVLRGKIGRAAAERALDFSVEAMVRGVEKIYRTVLA